jgi:hypothetical protein
MTHIYPSHAELNPICHLLALLAHHILHVSRIQVKDIGKKSTKPQSPFHDHLQASVPMKTSTGQRMEDRE